MLTPASMPPDRTSVFTPPDLLISHQCVHFAVGPVYVSAVNTIACWPSDDSAQPPTYLPVGMTDVRSSPEGAMPGFVDPTARIGDTLPVVTVQKFCTRSTWPSMMPSGWLMSSRAYRFVALPFQTPSELAV